MLPSSCRLSTVAFRLLSNVALNTANIAVVAVVADVVAAAVAVVWFIIMSLC